MCFQKRLKRPEFPYEYDIFHVCSLLWVKEAMLSLVSVMVIETEVVAVLPDAIPRRSWALTTTTYWLLVSRSRVFILQLITPGRRWQIWADGGQRGRWGRVISEVSADSYSSELTRAHRKLMKNKTQTCDAVNFEGWLILDQRVSELSISSGGVIRICCPHLNYFSSCIWT